MKKRIFLYLSTILALSFALTSCSNNPSEKSLLYIGDSYPEYSVEQLINEAELIVKGQVISVDEGVMINPTQDSNIKDETGRTVLNEQIHTYVFEIDTVYKGAYTEDTIEIKTSYGYALSPDLILYGEDETTILSDSLDRFELEVGSECILTLKFVDLHYSPRNGYYVLGLEQGVFSPDQAELFAK